MRLVKIPLGGAPKSEKRPDVGCRRAVEERHAKWSIGRKPLILYLPGAQLPGREREPGSVPGTAVPGAPTQHCSDLAIAPERERGGD
jgi:hypothetical protein